MNKKYKHYKLGTFIVEKPNGRYILPDGWERIEKVYKIIGECDLFYYYDKSNCINKTRLIRWNNQLNLFSYE